VASFKVPSRHSRGRTEVYYESLRLGWQGPNQDSNLVLPVSESDVLPL
jgi:hypothetical protein